MNSDIDYEDLSEEELEKLLTPKQRRFCAKYCFDWNATRAALRAGFGKGENYSSAAVSANRMLKDAKISAYLRARLRGLYNALHVSEESITLRLVDILERCMEGHEHMSWNPAQHCYEPDGTWNFDAKGAAKVLELLGTSIGMFEKKINISGGVSLEEYLMNHAGEGNGGEF